MDLSELVHTVMEFSTGHITLGDSKALDKFVKETSAPLIVTEYAYGYRIYCWEYQYETGWQSEVINRGLSHELVNLILIAANHGCKWLELDSDAIIHPKLPCFEW